MGCQQLQLHTQDQVSPTRKLREKINGGGNNQKGGNGYGFDQNTLYAFMKFSIKQLYKVIQT